MEITIDTHALVWYISGLKSKLSDNAFSSILEAEKSGIINVPIIVLMEILYLIEKGRINITFKNLLNMMESNESYCIIELNMDIIKIAVKLQGLQVHDRLIVASSIYTNTPLVSKDKEIAIQDISLIW